MSARITRKLIVPAIAAAAILLVPAAAGAEQGASDLSAVDSIAADVALDGSLDSKPATETAAGDSPTKDAYGTSTESVPPPVTCVPASTTSSSSGTLTSDSGSSTKPATDTSSKPATETCAIEECSAEDTDGKDANGNPCVKAETVTETVATTDVPCTEASDSSLGFTSGTVCGGGGVEPVEQPVVNEPVAGGGDPLPQPTEVSGGGAELPFTGMPLWYAIYGGFALMLAGAAFWIRGRVADRRA